MHLDVVCTAGKRTLLGIHEAVCASFGHQFIMLAALSHAHLHAD